MQLASLLKFTAKFDKEMTLLTSIFQRQLVSSPSRRAIAVDCALDAFHCVKEDEHFLNGRGTGIDVPPFACRFNKSALGGHMLGIADEDGWVQILDTRKTGSKSLIKEWHAHENAVFDLAWMEEQQLLVTASGDQTVRMWDVSRDDCLAVFKGHSCSVKSVDFREDDIFVFATGSRDGNVMVWDVRCNRRTGHFCQPVNKIYNAHVDKAPATPQRAKKKTRRSSTIQPIMNSGQQSVTAVVFQGSNKLISAGAVDGKIKIWDLRKTYTTLKQDPVPFHTFPYPGSGARKHGFSSLVLDSTHSRLFAGCTNDNIYTYSCTTLRDEPVCTFSGHLNSTFYVKAALSPDDLYLISGSSDNDAYIWRVTDPKAPPLCLTGHLGEVTSVAWCPSDQGTVVTCSDDNSFRIWRIDHGVRTNDSLNSVVGRSRRETPSKSSSPVSNKMSQLRTPESSPSRSPGPKRTLWTPPTKVFTNPRLNNISSPISVPSNSPRRHLNTTTPTKPTDHSQLLSPKIAGSSNGLRKDPSANAASYQATSPANQSHSLPLSPGCPVSSAPSPKASRSPQQLLFTWLQTSSRKRTHSDAETTRTQSGNLKHNSTTSMKKNCNMDVSEETLQSAPLHKPENENVQKDGDKSTNDTKRRCTSEQESPARSPLRKRLCVLEPLNSNELKNQGSTSLKYQPEPGKENDATLAQIACETAHIDTNHGDSKCTRALGTTFNPSKHAKLKCQAPGQLGKGKNWLKQWSEYHKAKYGEENIAEEKEQHNEMETVDETNDGEDNELKHPRINEEADAKPGQSILTYFKPVSPSDTSS